MASLFHQQYRIGLFPFRISPFEIGAFFFIGRDITTFVSTDFTGGMDEFGRGVFGT